MSVSATGRRVLVISGDTLPLPGLSTTGAGLRAWGLIKGLETRGHDVVYLMPETSLKSATPGLDLSAYRACVYNNLGSEDLYRRIRELSPDVLVFQHWSAAVPLARRSAIPAVIDFHGPLMLETLYQDSPQYESLRQTKIQTLAKADFFTCAGERQRHYFYPWLMQAGFDLRQDLLQVHSGFAVTRSASACAGHRRGHVCLRGGVPAVAGSQCCAGDFDQHAGRTSGWPPEVVRRPASFHSNSTGQISRPAASSGAQPAR